MSDEREIQEVLARYVRAADHRDGAAMSSLFLPEGKVEVFDHGRGNTLADEIAALQTDHKVDEELERMKEKLSTRASG